jgi:hypothetical protein
MGPRGMHAADAAYPPLKSMGEAQLRNFPDRGNFSKNKMGPRGIEPRISTVLKHFGFIDQTIFQKVCESGVLTIIALFWFKPKEVLRLRAQRIGMISV